MISSFSKLRSITAFFYQASVLQIRREPRRWRSFTAKPPCLVSQVDLGEVNCHQKDCSGKYLQRNDRAMIVARLRMATS